MKALILKEKLFPNLVINQALTETLFSGKRLIAFTFSLLQLITLFLILGNLNIEKGSGIREVAPIILSTFVINSFVSLRYRPAILFSTSLLIIYYAFGYFSGSLLVIAGLIIIGCCHLPIKLWMRIVMIAMITIGLVILRANLFFAPRAALIVPFLASMFMFRTIIYLYELKHSNHSSSIFQKLSYFFLFPNHCFLLFPIVDYKVYLKTYYNKPDSEIWQKGIRWMLRGIIHLIGYRIIYYHLLIGPGEVTNLLTLLQYMTCSYALILRLSGLFHFIIGLLCMFGLNLPPIFNNYLLATSFVNMWRRINVYWREFMIKIFFYPIMFKYKKIITKHLLATTMLTVFFITWAMHNYQWFWIRGYFPLTPMDILFWATLGICITVNSVWIDKTIGKERKQYSNAILYPLSILKMMGIFLFMSVMWSLWGSNSLQEWFFLLSKGREFTSKEIFFIISIFISILVFGSFVQYLFTKESIKKIFEITPEQTLALSLPIISILLLLSIKQSENYIPIQLSNFISSVSEEKLNNSDKENTERGYYKKLIDGENNSANGLWEVNLKRPKTFTSIDDISIRTTDLLTRTLKPNSKIKVNDYVLETNVFGLRDKKYNLTAPDNTFRIALLGGSYEMGSGVNNNELFESLTEERLNKNNTDSAIKNYEILNFAVGGYHLIQQVELCNTTVFNFKPNAVIYMAHTDEAKRLLGNFADIIQNGTNFKYPFLKNIKTLSGVKQSMSKIEIKEHLEPYMYVIIQWCYSDIAKNCRKNNAIPVWAYLPATADKYDDVEYQKIKGYAVQSGFVTMDLRDVYKTLDRSKIYVSDWDTHPNAEGHRIIFEKFYSEFIKNKDLIIRSKK
jgi:hypothetical protein